MEGPRPRPAHRGAIRRPRLQIIASGGVGSLDDLRALAAGGLDAVVVCRALYEARFIITEALTVVG